MRPRSRRDSSSAPRPSGEFGVPLVSTGALMLGSDYRALGAVQSLGRHGVEVWVVHDADRGIANVSRFTRRSVRWRGGDDEARVAFLLDLAERHRLQGWTLFPSRDDTAALCARHWDELSRVF